MVSTGGLEIDAVGKHLPDDFVVQSRPARLPPAVRIAEISKKVASQDKAGEIRSIVIAVDVGLLNVPVGKVTMEIKASQKANAKRLVLPGSTPGKHMEQPGPAEDAHGGLHRAGPVHGVGERIFADPVLQDVADRFCVIFVAGQQIGLPNRYQPLQPGNFPGNLDIARPIAIHVVDRSREAGWPAHIDAVIAGPVDGLP